MVEILKLGTIFAVLALAGCRGASEDSAAESAAANQAPSRDAGAESAARETASRAGDVAEEQSFEEAMQIVCNAPAEAKVAGIADPAERAQKLAQHIQDRLRNPEVIDMFQALATASPDQRSSLLLDEARRAGLSECPLAEL